jgi:hypothetical protein
MKAKKGMGFKAAQSQIAKKQGISKERAEEEPKSS